MAAAWGMDTNALQRFPTVNDKNFQVNDKKKLAQHTEGTKISPTAPCSIFLRRHTWRECISVRLGYLQTRSESKGNETDDRDEQPLASPVARNRDLWW